MLHFYCILITFSTKLSPAWFWQLSILFWALKLGWSLVILSVIIMREEIFAVENPELSWGPLSCSLTHLPAILTLEEEVLPAQAFGRKPNETTFVLARAPDLWGMLEYRRDQYRGHFPRSRSLQEPVRAAFWVSVCRTSWVRSCAFIGSGRFYM